MKRLTFVMAAGCGLLAACAEPVSTGRVVRDERPLAERVAMERLQPYPFWNTAFQQRDRVVVRGDSAWAAFRARLGAGENVATPDFARRTLVAAAMGPRSSGGFVVRIDSVLAGPSQVEVFVSEISPGRNCVVTAALTSPADAVLIPATTLPVVFRDTERVHHCD